jgi:hypothetical protein
MFPNLRIKLHQPYPSRETSGKESTVQSRVFVVGCGRSGTTLLQSMLSSHSRVASMPETWLFVTVAGYMAPRLYGNSPKGVKDRLLRIRDKARLRLGLAAENSRDEVRNILRELEREDLMSLFPRTGRQLLPQLQACVNILDRIAQDQDRPIWLEKSPLHLGYIDLIERVIPHARFIHILREGPDAVASLYDATQQFADPWRRIYPTLDHCIDQWNHCVKLAARYVDLPRHFLVRYEDLVSDTESTLRRLCRFLDIEFEGEMVGGYGSAAERLIREAEPWKKNVAGPVVNANGTKFHSLFDATQKRHILRRLNGIPANMRCSSD